jgi:hypothetical protein
MEGAAAWAVVDKLQADHKTSLHEDSEDEVWYIAVADEAEARSIVRAIKRAVRQAWDAGKPHRRGINRDETYDYHWQWGERSGEIPDEDWDEISPYGAGCPDPLR